ncbi:MAG: hypothetical protein ACRCSM_09090 [Sediminibacterium sp.]|jgi:hypothetical protein|nr:hypothetical protein [Chitinophagaceae bacterium]MCA6446009.1 hypothetical protein [Chitinophagaceae bacterium]
MENKYREQSRKGYTNFRKVYDITMAILFVLVGIGVMTVDRLGLNLVFTEEPLYKYGFGGICLLYGAFRLYRGIKQDY